jgi:hypothetical protein
MKTFLIGMVAVGFVVPVAAQTSSYQGSSVQLEAESRAADNLSGRKFETPTMRRQKLKRAEALRIEAMNLQAQDGGILSDGHVRYIREQSAKILNYSNATPPGIVPSRRSVVK